MKRILKEQDVNYFLTRIEKIFSNFVAGIVTDRDGFPLASKIRPNFHIQENKLSLSAIANNEDFIKDTRFLKVKRNLDKSENIRLFLLLEKDKSNKLIYQFKNLKKIIKTQVLF
ncbi:MAG: hypothetical protein ACFFAN_00165 [Promethearchaeota archaeon]